MPSIKPIQIFKAGTHTAMSGVALTFAESDLQACAAAYDPAKHEAPIVVGHPRHDAPAYGWVKSLTAGGGRLDAEPDQVDPVFAELFAAGRFKKISASFYLPDSPQNPVPGVYYLRHVGFLGAQPPAVKGLRPAEFGGGEDGTVEFADGDDVATAGLFRNLREWILAKFGQADADQAVPGGVIDALQVSAATEPADDTPAAVPGFSEHQPQQETVMPPDNADLRAAEFAERETQIAERERQLQEREAQLQREAEARAGREAEDFAEGLVKAGRILPRQRDGVAAVLGALDAGQALEFGEGDDKYKGTTDDWLRKFLGELPVQVDFSERSAAEEEAPATADFAAPSGYAIDPDRLALHCKAQTYQAAHDCDYTTALAAVGGR